MTTATYPAAYAMPHTPSPARSIFPRPPRSSPSSHSINTLLTPNAPEHTLLARHIRAPNPWHPTPIPPGAQMLISQPSPVAHSKPGHPQTKVWTKPPNKVGQVERWRLWWGSGVTPTAMLEWWEVLLVNTVILITLSLLYFALASLPPHLSIIARRARYYLSGSEELL